MNSKMKTSNLSVLVFCISSAVFSISLNWPVSIAVIVLIIAVSAGLLAHYLLSNRKVACMSDYIVLASSLLIALCAMIMVIY